MLRGHEHHAIHAYSVAEWKIKHASYSAAFVMLQFHCTNFAVGRKDAVNTNCNLFGLHALRFSSISAVQTLWTAAAHLHIHHMPCMFSRQRHDRTDSGGEKVIYIHKCVCICKFVFSDKNGLILCAMCRTCCASVQQQRRWLLEFDDYWSQCVGIWKRVELEFSAFSWSRMEITI